MDKDDEAINYIPWAQDIEISQNIITAILEIPTSYMELRKKLRYYLLI